MRREAQTTDVPPELPQAEEARGPRNAGAWAAVKWAARCVLRAPAELLVVLVRLYQILLSPILGGQCRFYPSCSAYFIQAVRKYGAVRGGLKGVGRVLRCHPFHRGGFDPP